MACNLYIEKVQCEKNEGQLGVVVTPPHPFFGQSPQMEMIGLIVAAKIMATDE